MKNKKGNNIQKKVDYLYSIATNNQTTIKVLSDFFYNYLDMKGDTDKYAEYMKEKVDGVLQESKDRIEKISRKSVQKDKKEKEK